MATGLQRAIELARTPVPDEKGSGTRRLPSVLVLLSDGKDTQSAVVTARGRAAGEGS